LSRPSETACTRATFTEDSVCLSRYDSHQQKALMVYFMAAELAALGGTDYTRELGPDGSLAPASACNAELTPYQRDLARLLIAQNNAADAGAVLPEDAALPDEIACLALQPPAMLDSMELTLLCLLGRHAAWPQVNV